MSRHGIEKYISKRMKLKILGGFTPTWMERHIRGRYIIKSTLSAPLWVQRKDFAALRAGADGLTEKTGTLHVLDHIVPVDHPYVCGLTVPWNMRVVPYRVNAFKRNNWHPDQESFDFPPQLPLIR